MSPARGIRRPPRALARAAAVLACVCPFAVPAAGAKAARAAALSIAHFSLEPTEGGEPPEYANVPYPFSQAGGHPFALTSRIEFSSEQVGETEVPTADPRDLAIELPPGLIATPAAVPSCPYPEGTPCPGATQVGTFVLAAHFKKVGLRLLGPLVNLPPARAKRRASAWKRRSGASCSVAASSTPRPAIRSP